ncbi:tapasin-related protein [Mixophyes fleayi]|uniref:tapasin-related protein n=1 Tax=Mixophyes fleayi TaxID=3061075 RepID=UPI003F4DF008
MKKNGYLLLGLILTLNSSSVWGAAVPQLQRAVDVVLPCEYVLLQTGHGGLGFMRQKVTLILRNITMSTEQQMDPLPDYQLPEEPEMTIFEATVNLAPLPFAERLLHVECEGEEVVCEISPLFSQFYAAHIRLPEISIAIVARTESTNDVSDQPLSDNTIVPMTVGLLVSSYPPLQKASVSEEVTLNCEVWGDTEGVNVEWHLQKDGKGQRLNPEDDSHITMTQEEQEGRKDLSLIIRQLLAHDDGTYICAVTSGQHQLQQILQLQIREPPQVTVFLSTDPTPTVTCCTNRYYPLDVEVSWLLNGVPVTHASPITSSHRRNKDGTYNLTSYLEAPMPPTGAPPDIYTCAVSHVSSDDPIEVQVHVLPPETMVSSGILGFIISFIVFIVALKGIYMFAQTMREGEREMKKTK